MTIHDVRYIIGAEYAYACIKHETGSFDALLKPGRPAARSLRESAAELQEKSARYARIARTLAAAADYTEVKA